MNKKINIDPIDEALRLIYLEFPSNADNIELSEELNNILTTEYTATINDTNKQVMISNLFGNASAISFGMLLNEAISQKEITTKTLSEQIHVSEELIEELKSDSVFTNNVPVMFVKNILQILNIPFKKAESAIKKTFELLKSHAVIEQATTPDLQPAFRKGYYSSREYSAWSGNVAESKELFENEEALSKYLSRLNELMNK